MICKRCENERGGDFAPGRKTCRPCRREQTRAWTAENRGRKNKTDREWKRRNRKKDRARGVVRRLVDKGALPKPERCEKCNGPGPLEGHHADYDAPGVVSWFCKMCHTAAHEGWPNRQRRLK